MKLHRSKNKVFAGVCAGFAEHFGWDVAMTRIIFAAITIFTGFLSGGLIYIVAAIVMPEE